MPIINGEKYACQSCIKGHRVSGCQHTDRELQHINPKGRPVKQCEHCRTSRKLKSHHARCECGHKKEKAKDKPDDAHAGGCACHTGAKCICGTKKDSHGLKLETPGKPKPRLATAHSESTLTVFANGHHKPCHRLNNTAHTSGMPYKIPRPHTLHGPPVGTHESSEMMNGLYNMPAQQRSLDHLAMPDMSGMPNFNTQPRTGESLPLTPIGSVPEEDLIFDPMRQLFGVPQVPTSVMGSGPNSPVDNSATQQWPWTAAPPQPQYGFESLSTSPAGEYFAHDNDWAIPSAGLQPSWSATDLPLSEKFGDAIQPISHCGESGHASVPGLSTSSSQSEIGEPHFFGEPDMKHQAPSHEANLWEEAMHFRKPRASRGISNASTPPDMRQAPTSAPTPESHHSRNSLDLDFLRRNSPPLAMDSENNNVPRRTYNSLAEAFATDKVSAIPAGNPFMGLETQTRTLAIPEAVEENGENLYGWNTYNAADMANPLENTDMSAYAYNINFL